jgi:hypothetical protein
VYDEVERGELEETEEEEEMSRVDIEKLTVSRQRRLVKTEGKDTFDLSDWWKSNCATLPGFVYVLRAVLTNSPNSCPPECLFSIFNATYNDDQKSSCTDYIELSMQKQFNKRVCSSRVSR